MIFHDSRPSPPFHLPAAAPDLAGRSWRCDLENGSTTTCGVCPRPRGTKYRRITIPSDATGPQEPPGADARAPSAVSARIPGGTLSNPNSVLLKKTRLYASQNRIKITKKTGSWKVHGRQTNYFLVNWTNHIVTVDQTHTTHQFDQTANMHKTL